jgi:hypothetical protein
MIKIFIHKITNVIKINDFETSLTDFLKLEPNIVLPDNFTEISFESNDDKAPDGIEYAMSNDERALSEIEGARLQARDFSIFDHETRIVLRNSIAKIDEYKAKLSEITYKKHITTNEIKTFKFGEDYDVEIWVDITEEEKTQYQTKIAKDIKKAELEIAYNQVKDKFKLTFDYNGTQKTYKEYKLWELMELTNLKKSVMADKKGLEALGIEVEVNDEFTAENQFNFLIDGVTIPVTKEQLMKLNIELNALIAAMYKKKQEILSEIEALNLAQDVIDYNISFGNVQTELTFNN